MILIDAQSRVPFYEQIKNQLMELIQMGYYKPNERLPSIRVLAQQLHLNVNTVKRAFIDLEHDGVIYSLPGRGSFVMENAFANEQMKCKALENVTNAITAGRSKGITRAQLEEVVRRVYGEDPPQSQVPTQ